MGEFVRGFISVFPEMTLINVLSACVCAFRERVCVRSFVRVCM